MEEAMAADRIIRLHDGKLSSDSNPVKIPIDKSNFTENDRYKNYSSLLNNLRNVSLGEYCKKKSLMHNLFPGAKILVFLAVLIATLAFQNIQLLTFACGISFLYGILAKYPIGKLLARILKMTPWILLFFAFLSF